MNLLQFSCKLSPNVTVEDIIQDIKFPYVSKVNQIYVFNHNIMQLSPEQKSMGKLINVRCGIVAIDTEP